jgi:hypothetical protein
LRRKVCALLASGIVRAARDLEGHSNRTRRDKMKKFIIILILVTILVIWLKD